MLSLSSYDYHLPSSLIAQSPATLAESARCLYRDGASYTDKTVADLPDLLDPDTLIIFNNSKVVKARIPLTHATRKTEDGKLQEINRGEIFFLQKTGPYQCEALINPGKKFQIGDMILQDNRSCKVIAKTEDGRNLEFSHDINDILESYGQMPLPPYITYDVSLTHRYQSIMAETNGSVAAPTASLHITPTLLDSIKNRGHQIATLTLHIGLGTFKTVQSEDITTHDIHDEQIIIPHTLRDTIAEHKTKGKPILAIGTTAVRSLESMPYIRKLIPPLDKDQRQQVLGKEMVRGRFETTTTFFRNTLTQSISLEEAKNYIHNLEIQDFGFQCSTKIFLYPEKSFHIIDQLLTNFHLPKSSLLMLVAAFMEYKNMMACYHHAVTNNYRFFSFGDCMLIKTNQKDLA